MFKLILTLSIFLMLTACNTQTRGLIGQGLGAYAGAKLCGGSVATQIGCGAIGGEVGNTMLSDRPSYIEQQRQQQGQYYQPRQPQTHRSNCQNVVVVMADGRGANGISCQMPNGQWKIVHIS